MSERAARDVRTRKTPTPVGVKKPDAKKLAGPHGHGDARQALSELRRIVDAARHRIRGKLIRCQTDFLQDKHQHRQPHRCRGDIRENLMAETLAPIIRCRSGLPVPGLFLLLIRATTARHGMSVSREDEHGHDNDQEC